MIVPGLTLTAARLWHGNASGAPAGAPELVDIGIERGRVASVRPAGSVEPGDGRVVDLGGRWVMPGLVDHHVHFTMWAKHRGRLSLAGVHSAVQAADVVLHALAEHPDPSAADLEPLVGRGFQDALWPDVPTAQLLDDVAARVGQLHRAIVLISHDLHSVWLNSAAAVRYGVPSGLLRESSAFEAEIAVEQEESADPLRVETLVAAAVEAASARGVTGILDLEMADNPAVWARRVADGLTALRVAAGVYPAHLEEALARGERTGKRVVGTGGLVTVGPLKVFTDGALNTRTAWCFDPYPHTKDFGHSAHPRGDLERILADARAIGFDVALHAIGDRAVSEALDAFEGSGASGSIEHAQLVRAADVARFTELGLVAGVQPEHALDDREVTDLLWKGRTSRAFPLGDLARAGVTLAMGSDAPVAPLDPWFGISAAVHRTRDEKPAWELANRRPCGD